MKRRFRSLFPAFLILIVSILSGAPHGQFVGTWASDSGSNSGKVNVTITGSGDGDFTFTYQDQTIKPQKVTAKVSDTKVEFLCELDMQGLKIRSTFTGAVDGKTLSGKYQSTSADDGSVLDSGTWKATQE